MSVAPDEQVKVNLDDIQLPQDTPIHVSITLRVMQQILDGLSFLPHNQVHNTITDLKAEAQNQIRMHQLARYRQQVESKPPAPEA